MMTNFTCTRCRNTVDEDYALFNLNNPRDLKHFTAVCNSCTRKAHAKADWVAVARTEYNGSSRLLRWFCGVQAAAIFEQAWAGSTTNKPIKSENRWWEPLPMTDEQIVKTALGEFHCHRTDDGVKVTSSPGYKTRQQAIEDRYMITQSKYKAAAQRHVFAMDPVTLPELVTAVRVMGGSVVVVDGAVISFPFCQKQDDLGNFLIGPKQVSFGDLESLLHNWQVDRRLDSLYIDQINGVYEVHAAFVPRGETAAPVQPTNAQVDELVSSKLNIQDLCRVMEVAFDKAGPDRDYSMVVEYKQAGDLATANLKLEVVGVHKVPDETLVTVKIDSASSPEQISRDLAAMAADRRGNKGSPDAGAPGPDLGYGSEFDLLMMAAGRHLREFSDGVPGITLAQFLEVPTYYNKWYAAVKADRRREWEISNTPHPEV